MADSFTMHMTGGPVEVPATISGIRGALPEELRAAFTAEAENTVAAELPLLLARWALRIPTAQDAEEEALVERLRAGDFSGVTFSADHTDEYRSAG